MDPTLSNSGNANEESFLTSLIKRLEAATGKIESIILSNPSNPQRPAPSSDQPASNADLTRLMAEYLSKCSEIHPIVESQGLLLKEAILETIQSKSPSSQQKVAEYISKIQLSKDRREFDPILRVVVELSPILGWPWTSGSDLITLFKGAKESGEFYRNKVYLATKNGQIPGIAYELVVSWAGSLFNLIDGLKRVAVDKMSSSAGEPDPSSFSEVVCTSTIRPCPPIAPPRKEDPKHMHNGPPPLIELRGDSKWIVEGQHGTEISMPQKIETKHSIYIFKCKDSVLPLEGSKFTTASIDQCENFGLVVEKVVSGIEIVRSKGCQIQVLGFCPTISIDSSERIQIYLSKECVREKTQIVTSNSSSVNILVQSSASNDGDDEWIEKPIPEQFVSMIHVNDLSIVTTPQSHI